MPLLLDTWLYEVYVDEDRLLSDLRRNEFIWLTRAKVSFDALDPGGRKLSIPLNTRGLAFSFTSSSSFGKYGSLGLFLLRI